MPEQIDLARVRAAGVRDLKHYLEFAIRGARALAQQSSPTGLDPDSPFEVAVIKMLRDRGWVVHPQVGCSGYRIDLAIVDPRAPGRYLAGIECDGRAYHSGATARDRDRLRQHVLESLGWRIYRIWSTDWWMNPEGEVEKISASLHSLLESDEDDDPGAEESLGTSEESDTDPIAEAEIEASVAADTTVPGVPVGAQIYAPVTLISGDPVLFYEPRAARTLAEHLKLVVEAEGPLPEAALFRRVARAWGLERTGSRITERLRGLVPPTVSRTTEPHETFYWPSSVDPKTWDTFRVADDSELSRRHVTDVCLEEVAALVRHVLRQAGGAPRQDVARSVCRLLGMARTPADAERRVGSAIDNLISSRTVTEVAGRVRLFEHDLFARFGDPFASR